MTEQKTPEGWNQRDAVHRAWKDIQRDYKMTNDEGVRLVMFWHAKYGTTLGPWHGPACTDCPKP